jgi:hypothetical protein
MGMFGMPCNAAEIIEKNHQKWLDKQPKSFIAQPTQTYHVGQPICRAKRRCDVVYKIEFPISSERALELQGKAWFYPATENMNAAAAFIRPMTWWESLKHELFGDCESDRG